VKKRGSERGNFNPAALISAVEMTQEDALKIRFLGELEIERNGRPIALPQSRKTRALLAYLVLNARPQRRDRLCALFWDVTDDPRGALRWSLSRLRPLVDSPHRPRIVAGRDQVQFDSAGIWIDVFAARDHFESLERSVLTEGVDELREIAALFRGEFLEGLELPDFDEYQAWCVAQREQCRLLRVQVLSRILERLSDATVALPYARALIQIDPLSEFAHVVLLRLLISEGRLKEAERQYETAIRLLKEAGNSSPALLHQTWQSGRTPRATISVTAPPAVPAPPPNPSPRIVGRDKELDSLRDLLTDTARLRRLAVVVIGGEPGIGKTRLLSELTSIAQQRGATVIEGRAFEAESSRPYGPWIEALSKIPKINVGSTIGADLAAFVPQLAPVAETSYTREKMFGAVVELIAARAHSSGIVVLAMDDIQWFDEASAELLHYVVRSNRHRPLLVLLAARAGELPDNMPMLRVLRSIRRDSAIEQIPLEPLTFEQTKELVAQIDPALADLSGLSDTSGNPLFALELARSSFERKEDVLPPTLIELVRDRFERLPAPAPEVLRWGGMLGSTFTATTVTQLSGIDPDAMMQALERLERHGLIRGIPAYAHLQASYAFSHDLVRQVVYTGISEPRRRIMHGRAASYLSSHQEQSESVAADVVYHAALAGDSALAASSCVAAGRQCLRLFANLQAEIFAKRGMRFAEQLGEPERVKLLIELTQVHVAARRPDALDAGAEQVEQLAERALDYGCMMHARLAFHISSYLRWEGGDWSVAERDTLRAELVSRAAGTRERVTALAEAARCLAMLERDIGHASALLIEASRLAEKTGAEALAIPMAEAIIHQHEGRSTHAVRLFRQALELAQRDRDRENEFMAIEHLVMFRINQEEYDEAFTLAGQLVTIGEKLREGSEAPFARVLRALSIYARDSAHGDEMSAALEALRSYDAKHRMAFALTRAALIDLKRGRTELAETRASEALRLAEALKRQSEIAVALTVLGEAAIARGELAKGNEYIESLQRIAAHGISRHARTTMDSFVAKIDSGKGITSYGTGGRRKNVRGTGRV
jgi:predicted ATPase/DNA-binding SARP family transcriptional activator